VAARQELIELLERAIADRTLRVRLVKQFQKRVWDSNDLDSEPHIARVLRDLAFDLDFFEPDEKERADDPALYGEDRLEEEIRSALLKLRP
jgi:hypothetical protein